MEELRQPDLKGLYMRLAVVTTHPIQYYAPLFRRVADAESIDLRVFYGWRGSTEASYDPGFEQEVQWDLPLLEGYDHTFVPNESDDPGTHHFRGLVNPELVPRIEEWGPDAVLLFGWSWQSHLQALRHFSGQVPVLFRGDSTLIDEQFGLRTMVRRAWLWWVYRHVDCALYVGTNNRQYFEAHGLGDEQLHWVPHAIENQRFYDSDDIYVAEAHVWGNELGISSEESVILFAGKLERKKAPDVLVDAFRHAELPNTHLVMVGSGPLEEKLREAGDEHSRIHFLGFQNQSKMPIVYRLGDLFVLPSRGPGETWGLAVNEAMACGCAVIVSDKVGCAPDLVGDENGAVVPAEDVMALRNTLDDLLQDRETLSGMGQFSRERISDWTIEKAAARMEEAVRRTVNKS